MTTAPILVEPSIEPQPLTALTPLLAPVPAPVHDSPAVLPLRACPRCGSSALLTNYDETTCVNCGYVEYLAPPDMDIAADDPAAMRGPAFRATTYVARYGGPFSEQKHRLVYVTTYAYPDMKKHDAQLRVKCPWDSLEMERSSLSGKRKRHNETRFRCPDGHRLSLLLHPGDNPWVWE